MDDSGAVNGMLCVVTEETERVIGERRMATLQQLASALSGLKMEHEVLEAIEQQLATNPKDMPFALTYLFDDSGNARLACSTGISAEERLASRFIPPDTNTSWPASDVYLSATSRVVDVSQPLVHHNAWVSPRQAFVVPINQQGHERPAGFLVVAANPYRRCDDAYAGFIDLLAGQIAASLANSNTYQEERRRAEALAELDRAKTLLFSNVSHEFRTPLTLMLGPVEDLLTESGLGNAAGHLELLKVIQRNGMRLQKLVNSLLDFSRIEAGRSLASYQPRDLATFTSELASSFHSAMQRANLSYTVQCEPLSPLVFIDPDMWEKVVLNLISNAFKYTLTGSIAVRVVERPGRAEFSVTDTGVGIPKDELPNIFARFHRVEGSRGRTQEGTGIGLALVQELVKLHGGNISAASEFGTGSTFTVSLDFGFAHLPKDRLGAARALTSTAVHANTYVEEALRWLPGENGLQTWPEPETSDTADVQGSTTRLPALRRGRVLLADDNADMRDYVGRLLSAQYEVTAVANGEEALAAALANPPDLVLTDVIMPILDGFGLLRALRDHRSTRAVPVLLLSARAGAEASVEALDAGADDYLIKPFTARELLARVGAHLQLKLERQRTYERLSQIFSETPVAICVLLGRELVFELANPAYENLLQGRQLLGRRLADVIPELDSRIFDVLPGVIDSGEAFSATDFLVTYDQNHDGISEDHWFNLVYHPLREPGGPVSGIVCALTDVTPQVRSREELIKANRELEQFSYVASHDLHEPLRMINIYTQLLMKRSGMDGDAEQKKFAEFVRSGVRRMEALIQDLLNYSRVIHPEQEELGRVDLRKSSGTNITGRTWRPVSKNSLPLTPPSRQFHREACNR